MAKQDALDKLKTLTSKAAETAAPVAEATAAPEAPVADAPVAPAMAEAPSAPVVAPTMPHETQTKVLTPEELARKQAREQRNNMRSQLASQIKNKAVASNTPRYQLLQAASDMAAICGYITKTDSRTDFVASSVDVSGSIMYKIRLRQTPPSSVVGVIVRYPATLLDAFTKGDTLTFEDVSELKKDDQQYLLDIVDKEDLASRILSQSMGYMLEADEIFTPYYTKARQIPDLTSVSNVKKEGIPSKSCLYVDVTTRNVEENGVKKMKNTLVVKHSYRTRWQTPGNYIALRRAATIPMQEAYSQADASAMIDLYLNRFTQPNRNNIIPVAVQHRDTAAAITAAPNNAGGQVIKSTQFFPINATDNWSKNPHLAVAHWYKKTADGEPVYLTLKEIELVRKELRENKEKGTTRAVVEYKDLKDANAAEGTYRFDPQGEHAKIYNATKGMLTYDMLDRWSPKTKRSKTGTTSSVSLAGRGLAGISQEDLKTLLAQFGQ